MSYVMLAVVFRPITVRVSLLFTLFPIVSFGIKYESLDNCSHGKQLEGYKVIIRNHNQRRLS